MMELFALTRRNCKLFFKDKGMFFTSLITPVILLVLYVTFLGKVYNDSFTSAMPEGFAVDGALIDGVVGGQLISSILAVCCVTVAFCSNLLMVNDKITGARHDLTMAPVKSSTLAMSYFFATFTATLIISLTALVVCLGYLAFVGWYMTVTDVILMLLDVVLLVLFGTALSSLINAPLSTSGQSSAVGTIVSAGYGFICGAYMPISNFGEGLQKVLSFLPGTYGTSLLRNHAMAGAYRKMAAQGFPAEVVKKIRDSVDCNLYFFGDKVEIGTMYVILGGAVLLLIGLYVLYNCLKAKAKS
ncbi:MAG: ABC transporter permease [Oscillospiraceae bacterium]|nr:ABC transporter permease [Oscillospiraceae bacterium]